MAHRKKGPRGRITGAVIVTVAVLLGVGVPLLVRLFS